MYDQIANASASLFDGDTENFLGKAQFSLSDDSQKKLLDLLNYGKIPEKLVVSDVSLYDPAKGYVPPELYEAYRRSSVLNAVARDKYSGEQVPVEIRLKYDSSVRSHSSKNPYYIDCVGAENIEVVDVREIYF